MGRVWAVPSLCELSPCICLTAEEKLRKTLSQTKIFCITCPFCYALEDLDGRIFGCNHVIIFKMRQYCVTSEVLSVVLPKFQVLRVIHCVRYIASNDSTQSKEITVLHFDCLTLKIKESRSFEIAGTV